MANYIIENLATGMNSGDERYYPRLVNTQLVGTERIAQIIEERTSFKRGDVLGVLAELVDVVEETLANGDSLKIDGLGVLRPILGLADKDRRGDWTDEANRLTTARNTRLKTIGFRPSPELIKSIGQQLQITRVCDSLGRQSVSTSKEERILLAQQYIADHGFMRVADYMRLTGLSRASASKELRQIEADSASGISSTGSHSSKVYVARQ